MKQIATNHTTFPNSKYWEDCKNLLWLWGADWTFRHKGNCYPKWWNFEFAPNNYYGFSFWQVRLKPACSATEARSRYSNYMYFTIWAVNNNETGQLITMKLSGCAGWSMSLLFACDKTGFLMMGLKWASSQKTCLKGLRPGKTQTGLRSHRD